MTRRKTKSKALQTSAAIAPAVLQAVSEVASSRNSPGKKGKKKKKGSLMNFLSGAAKVAAEVAPVVAPLLLAKHAPTRAAMALGGTDPATSAVGIASPLAIQPMTGLTAMSPIIQNGRIHGVRLSGIDFLGQVSVDANGAVTGDILAEVSLNPTTADWLGTRLQREMSLWERFRFRKFAMLFEPSVPTTQPGQMVMFIDTDPDEDLEGSGLAVVQQATAHSGSEMFQVWEAGTAEYLPDTDTQDFFADADGSDQRLISPGNAFLVASTDLQESVYGALYGCYDVELLVPQIEDGVLSAYFAQIQGDQVNADALQPMGDGVTTVVGGLPYSFEALLGSGSTFYGIPPGRYYMTFTAYGTTINLDAETYFAVTGAYTSIGGSAFYATGNNGDYAIITATIDIAPASLSEWKTRAYGSFALQLDNGTGSVTGTTVIITRVPSGVGRRAKPTVQSLEDQVQALMHRLSSLERASAPPPSPPQSSQIERIDLSAAVKKSHKK